MTNSYDISELRRAFTQKCLDRFRFLTAYGCELTSIEEDTYGVEVTYKNRTTGIKVSFDVKENDVSVYLIRLVNEEIPAYLDAPSRWFYLDNVVELRSPSTTLPRQELGNWLAPDDIDHILAVYAEALKEYGEDVLRGGFSVFDELARRIDRPRPSSNRQELELIASNEELNVQKKKLLTQIVVYYDTYFSELRRQLQRPGLFSEAVPEFLKGYKKVISVGGGDGLVIAHFPVELKITISKADDGDILMQFPSEPYATKNSYEFLQLPELPVSDLVTILSAGEEVGLEISPGGALWGVRGFTAPQQQIDPTTGELIWQSPWTRLVCADLYHLRFWENTERARREAEEDIEPYVRSLENANGEHEHSPHLVQWVYKPEPEVREELAVGTGLFSAA